MTNEFRTDAEPDPGDLVIDLLASTLSGPAIGSSGMASPRRLSASRKPWHYRPLPRAAGLPRLNPVTAQFPLSIEPLDDDTNPLGEPEEVHIASVYI
jgi:hypothetical protein